MTILVLNKLSELSVAQTVAFQKKNKSRTDTAFHQLSLAGKLKLRLANKALSSQLSDIECHTDFTKNILRNPHPKIPQKRSRDLGPLVFHTQVDTNKRFPSIDLYPTNKRTNSLLVKIIN